MSQTSARDFNITMRGATSTLATSTLALLDGRSLYLDFFGFVAWDLLPVNPNELRQIEVIRGPASAVWGANAMNGVVNFISKTPRELERQQRDDHLRHVRPRHRRRRAARQRHAVRHQRHARARGQRSLGLQDLGRRLHVRSRSRARPAPIPERHRHAVSDFANQGTTQPKFDTRVDYDAPTDYKLVFAGGYSGTDGIFHTGIGPFDGDGVGVGYGTMRYSRGGAEVQLLHQPS